MIQFSAVHQFADGHKVAAFQLQEMGESGTGSIDHGDASGDIFWLQYPVPFLMHYYNPFPEMLPVEMRPTQSGSAAVPAPSATRRRRDAPVEQGEQGEQVLALVGPCLYAWFQCILFDEAFSAQTGDCGSRIRDPISVS